MKTTFIHTADWQLWKPFAPVRDDAKRNRLRDERIQVIERIGRVRGADSAVAGLGEGREVADV